MRSWIFLGNRHEPLGVASSENSDRANTSQDAQLSRRRAPQLPRTRPHLVPQLEIVRSRFVDHGIDNEAPRQLALSRPWVNSISAGHPIGLMALWAVTPAGAHFFAPHQRLGTSDCDKARGALWRSLRFATRIWIASRREWDAQIGKKSSVTARSPSHIAVKMIGSH